MGMMLCWLIALKGKAVHGILWLIVEYCFDCDIPSVL